MNRVTKVPGMKDQHRVITNECFENRGLRGVLEEVQYLVADSISDFYGMIPKTSKIHVVITIEHEQELPDERGGE